MDLHIRKASAAARHAEARAINPAAYDKIMGAADKRSAAECWPMHRLLGAGGYGSPRVGGVKHLAHRVIFGLYFPAVAAPVVRHICHNPACVNPAHLRAGTPADNAMDRKLAGRGGDLRGERNGRAKLTEADVRAIRASAERSASLARQYGVSKVAVGLIRKGKLWPHVSLNS